VSKSLPIVTYPALQLLLLRQLHEVICLRSDVFFNRYLSTGPKIEAGLVLVGEPQPPIFLQRVKGKIPILYSSAIALKLAKPCGQTALELANAIAAQVSQEVSQEAIAQTLSEQLEPEGSSWILRNFTVKAELSGWLYFELSSAGLATWLQLLAQAAQQTVPQERDLISQLFTPASGSPNSSAFSSSHVFDSFPVQYAHARCLSLLRLAHEPGLVPGNWVPWLNALGELRFSHATEHSLIFALIDTVDELLTLIEAAIAQSLPPAWQLRVERLAATLAQAFLNFYDACRFWGEVQQQDPALVQARLGLVLATQPLLQLMLQGLLGLSAPSEF
jgi:hypothetical protein